MSRRLGLPVLVVSIGLAGCVSLIWPTYPNYDSYYHLVWGRELLSGLRPSFEAYAAPTQHPLYLLFAAVLSLLGEHADRLLVVATLAAFALLVLAVYRIGLNVFGRLPALTAAALTLSSFALQLYALRGYVDVPFLALVCWAAVYELERPRQGYRVPFLLTLAGLLRPEAWLLGLLYLTFRLSSKQRENAKALLVFAVAAPAGWMAVDLVVTGSPLHSLQSTSQLAEALGRERGLGSVPAVFTESMLALLRPPVALLAVFGVVAAAKLLGLKRIGLPLLLLVTGIAVFTASGLVGLSLIPRYLTLPAVACFLFAGYGLFGFTVSAVSGRWRSVWKTGSVVTALLGVGFLFTQLSSLQKLGSELRFVEESRNDLRELLHKPAVQQGLTCGPLTFPNYRLVPDARWLLDLPRDRVGARSALRREYGVAVFPLGVKALKRFGFADGASPRTNVPDPGFLPLARTRFFAAYGSCKNDGRRLQAASRGPS